MKLLNVCLGFIFCFLLISIPALLVSTAFARSDQKPKFASGELLVKIKPQGNLDNIKNKFKIKNSIKILDSFKLKENKLSNIQKVGLDRLYKLEVSDNEDIPSLSRLLSTDPDIEYAEPNYEVSTTNLPNDPSFNLLWGLNNTGQTGGKIDADIDALETWDIATGSSGLIVGIIDTGVDYNHPDLKDNMWVNLAEIPANSVDDDGNGFVDDVYGYDFINNDADPFDDYGHGTHVAGTIGAVGNNSIGVTGINWSAKMMAIKFLNSSGSGYIEGAVQSLLYANMMGAKVTNNSWGGGGYSQALSDAIAAADAAGDLFIAAAGNNSSNNDTYAFYPASYTNKNVIAVAATDASDNLASFSNYGLTSVHVAAPGVLIYSTVPTSTCSLCDPSGYKYLSGTSMATPHVAGSAALIWANNLALTNDQVKAKLINTSESVDSLSDKSISRGRINLFNSFENDSVAPSPITDLTSTAKSFDSVTLSWTATGDDGNIGTANQYDIRFSTLPITQDNFDSLPKLSGLPKPQVSGQTQTFVISGLNPSTIYYFAIKVLDNMGNVSSLSNVLAVTTPFAQVVWSDDMEASSSAWVVTGDSGNASASASLWHISERKSTSPTHSWYYGREDTGTFNTGARNWGDLTSPSINSSGVANPQLNFKHFLKTENLGIGNTGYAPYYDTALVQVSSDGGINWNTLLSDQSTNDWVTKTFDLTQYQNQNIKIRFSFDTVDSIVNDYEGWYIDDIQIFGQVVNQKPIANPGGPYTVSEDQSLTLDGSASSDPDGDPISSFTWDFGDGQSATTQAPSIDHVYQHPGSYQLTLVVNDGQVDSDPKTTTVTVLDTTPPTASITSPVDNSIVSGIVTITADATDNVGVTMVDFLVDGVVVGRDSTAPYSYLWDSNNSVGKHILSANAYDGASNMQLSAPVNVTVLDVQAPSITITNPLNNSTVKRGSTTTITTAVSDNVGVYRVEFYVNNALKCTDTTTPFTCDWQVPSKPNVLYTVVGIASDGAGNNSSASSSVKATAK